MFIQLKMFTWYDIQLSSGSSPKTDKPGGRSHPDFALQYLSWVTIKQIFIDDVLFTEVLVSIRFSLVCTVLMV